MESYKKFIKIPGPMFEDTCKSVGQRLEEESNIYSPLGQSGRNQVEHFDSGDPSIDEFDKYRNALDNSSNSRSKNRRKLYLELIRKFEDEEYRSRKKRRSKSKS
jgi:hypothetical protein